MFDTTQPFLGDPALPAPVITKLAYNKTLYSYYDASGYLLGEVSVYVQGEITSYKFVDSAGASLGLVDHKVSGDTTNLWVYDASNTLVSRERTIDRPDYTTVETWDASGFTGAVKHIHTATRTGAQYYDENWVLVSAHLEIDNGAGRTQVADYGPDWFVIFRETTTVSGNVTTTVIEENGAGNVTGGTVVTVKSGHTLVETYGQDWVLTGAVKEIHTDTQTGVQTYDGDWNLLSAHLETDNGAGRTQVADYGPDWFVIYRETTTVSGNVTKTVIEENGAGNITGGTVVTVKAGFTLVETFGAGWVLQGGVKTIHTATTTGKQVYDANWMLLSASLAIIDGNRHVTEEYGPDWSLISRLRVTTTEDKVVTELIEGEDATLMWRKIFYGDGADDENRYQVFHGDGSYDGTTARDLAFGDDGDDVFLGGAGDDVFTGGAGGDWLDGGDDADDLDGGDGDDTLLGGDGNDVIRGGNGDDYIEGGSGDDEIDGSRDDDTILAGDGNDDVKGGAGNDVIDGGEGNDVLEGGNGQDTIQGGDGDDIISGGSGDDDLTGGKGADEVDGSNGMDRLIAAGSGDLLTGGEDADVFVFAFDPSDTGAVHTITDFEFGIDGIEWHLGGALVPDAFEFVGQPDATLITYDADLDGTADLSVRVVGVSGLTLASIDFV